MQASQDFKDWKMDEELCHFPEDRNLTYFGHYSNDDCLMECRIKKISMICRCLPWFIPRTSENDLQLCEKNGHDCFKKELEKLSDISNMNSATECTNCMSDCIDDHWITKLERQPFHYVQHRKKELFNRATSSGYLANYLIDPENIFTDELTRNITMLAYGSKSRKHFAEQRFKNDISVCNFFFDTPYITEIRRELKTSMFDMITAMGGTIALFTGVSAITLSELGFGMFSLFVFMFTKITKTSHPNAESYENNGHEENQRNRKR